MKRTLLLLSLLSSTCLASGYKKHSDISLESLQKNVKTHFSDHIQTLPIKKGSSIHLEINSPGVDMTSYEKLISDQIALNGYKLTSDAAQSDYNMRVNVMQLGELPTSWKQKALASPYGHQINGHPLGEPEDPMLSPIVTSGRVLKNNQPVNTNMPNLNLSPEGALIGLAAVIAVSMIAQANSADTHKPHDYGSGVFDIQVKERKNGKTTNLRMYSELKSDGPNRYLEDKRTELLGNELVKQIAEII